jgi:N-acetylmuramoyl-L-alanine amidase/PKD repeat protein
MQLRNNINSGTDFNVQKFRRFKAAISLFIIFSFLAIGMFVPNADEGRLFASSKIKVFLDPGHGGSDPGAVWFDYQEKVPDLDITLRVKSKLEAKGFEVVMSRTSDTSRSLDDRVALANKSGADIFVSIHNNAALSPYAHGTETYWCANGVQGSNQLASLIQSNTVSSAGRANRGVKTANFRVIKYTTMPAALIECAFMSNQTESDLLKTSSFRDKLATGIYKGIIKFAEGINKSSSDDDDNNSGGTTTTTGGGTSSGTNTYSDLSKANSSGFTVNIELPANDSKIFTKFELRGWAADLRGTPPKKLARIEVYKVPDRKDKNLLGKIDNFDSNVMGSQGVLSGGFSLNIDIDKLSAGENILYVYAFDEKGNFSIGNVKIIVIKSGDVSSINKNPVAVPGGPYSGETGKEIRFDGSGSYDPDGVISEYSWDFGDGTDKLTGNAKNAAKPVHIYSQKGKYTVTLTVKDALGKVSAGVRTTATVTDQSEVTGQTSVQEMKFDNVSNNTSIVGYIDISEDSLLKIFKDRNSDELKRAARLAPLYIKYAKLFNLRADIAWAQMCHETNFLEFTGDVKSKQNNFAGLGATGGGNHGCSFDSEKLGVIAHLAHLSWYYFPKDVNKYCTKEYDPRHFGNGHINYTGNTTLGFLNGRWAPGSKYTDKIILFANQIIQGVSAITKIDAKAGPDKSAIVGETVIFDASASKIQIGTNDNITYYWDWNNDGKYDTPAETAVVQHIFEKYGTFKVKLKILSDSGIKSTDSLKVYVNSVPVADAGGPYTGKVNKKITFNGSKSSDPDGKIKKYLWDYGDGSTGSGKKPEHKYTEPGNYLVKLTVVDDKGVSSTTAQTDVTITGTTTESTESAETESSDGTSESTSSETTAGTGTDQGDGSDESSTTSTETTTTETTIPNQVPVANPGGPYSAKTTASITFDGSKSSDADGSVSSYTWDFGDGSSANGQKPSHAYAKAGTYNVKLIVKDNLGLESAPVTTTATITADETSQYQANTSIITNSTNIIGYTEVSVTQLVSLFVSRGSGKVERATRLAPIYIKYGKIFNVRADILWAQMCHETGFLEYTGDVKPDQNNFAGIGATGGGVPGNSFATEELGVIAHFAHIAWYYYPDHVNQYCNNTYDPRHFGTTHYKYTGDTTVGFLNGRWAPGSTYTSKILQFANQIYGH